MKWIKLSFVLFFTLLSYIGYGQQDSCARNNIVIDTFFYKVHNNVIYDTCKLIEITQIDTVPVIVGGDTIRFDVDTITYFAANVCINDELMFCGYGVYDTNYNLSDNMSWFTWLLGNGDSVFDINATRVVTTYDNVGCYDVYLKMFDYYGCPAINVANIRVRVAGNPIKRMFSLPSICSVDSLLLDIGYESNSTILLDSVNFRDEISKTYAVKTFIPDGMNQCQTNCFSASVTFDEFPDDKKIQSPDDICSICINMEHSYMGDYRMSLICPTGQRSVLKYGNKGTSTNCDPLCPPDAPNGSFGGGGQYLGIPYGGINDFPYDNLNHNYCDSAYNMFGEGLEYCFSRNGNYVFASGRNADVSPLIEDDYIASTNTLYQTQFINHVFQPIPAPYINAGQTAQPSTFSTKTPSDHTGKTNYYAPAEDFTNLIGCPLNGQWSIEICDFWPADNGWIFSWDMDICGVNQSDCKYQVGIDSVIWTADDNLNFRYKDSINAYISSNTSGTFPMTLHIYDDFGCSWDTISNITIVQTPELNLIDSLSLCEGENVTINASDRFTNLHNSYSYIWDPKGEHDSIVTVQGNSGDNFVYVVEVTNTQDNIRCASRDSTKIHIKLQPRIMFEPSQYPLEGCEPFEFNVKNYSRNVSNFIWDFGDNTSACELNPIHYYKEGSYDVKCFATSQEGCKDSLILPNVITVFSAPTSMFSWDPIYPSVTNPTVHFKNLSSGNANIYRWEIQYDKNMPYSFHTLTDVNPDFTWYTNGEDISGEYFVNLITFSKNIGPSGNITECRDTLKNSILVVNDFIQFPNVVTPNGDGFNDVFAIVNLLSGAYPTNSLWIYNKWGSLVYHVNNISTFNDFWDPNKTKSPDGSYFFRFSGNGYTGLVERNGVIEVLR